MFLIQYIISRLEMAEEKQNSVSIEKQNLEAKYKDEIDSAKVRLIVIQYGVGDLIGDFTQVLGFSWLLPVVMVRHYVLVSLSFVTEQHLVLGVGVTKLNSNLLWGLHVFWCET